MVDDIKSLKAGVLSFLSQNKRSGFTQVQVTRAFFGNPDNVPESDREIIGSILESLSSDKKISKHIVNTKSGQKIYYQGA